MKPSCRPSFFNVDSGRAVLASLFSRVVFQPLHPAPVGQMFYGEVLEPGIESAPIRASAHDAYHYRAIIL